MKCVPQVVCSLIIALPVLCAHARQPAANVPQSQPTTQLTADRQRRFDELVGVIEGQNTPEARRTGARELLRQGWPTTPQRLTAILSGNDAGARSAVAWALSDLPEHIVAGYFDPLVAMLAVEDSRVRTAAAAALAADRSGAAIPKLRGIAKDSTQTTAYRRTTVDTLAIMIERDAVAVLVELLDDPAPEMRTAVLLALESATGLSFAGGVETAKQWWTRNRELPLDQWQRQQIETLIALRKKVIVERDQILTRLVKLFRDNYLRTAEGKRGGLLTAYLADEQPAVRLLALELVQSSIADRKPLAADVTAGVRARLKDADARVRESAVSIVAGFRDPADAAEFMSRLTSETQPAVRIGLINGLGFIGNADAVDPLLKLMSGSPPGVAAEAASALGRLAERGVLAAEKKEGVAAALLATFQSMPREQSVLREALLRAMVRVADARFATVFSEALNSAEPPAMRQAAAAGIDALGDASLLGSLLAVVDDADAGLRRTAVAALARLGISDADLGALWGRLSQTSEANTQIRDAAWSGVMRILNGRPAADVVNWVGRLPDNGQIKATRAVELLRFAEKTLAANADAGGELGRVRADIAAHLIVLGRADDAVAAYLRALADLHSVKSPEIPRVSIELLRFALTTNRYDEKIAAAFANGNPPLDGAAVWNGIKSEIDKRIVPDSVDQAIRMLAALQARPPTSMPADVVKAMADALVRARALRAELDAKAATAAVAALRANAGDQAARAAIAKLGVKSAAALKEMLKALISAEQPDAAAEKLFHDLLKTVLPKWPGFAPEAVKEDKLKAVEAAAAG